MKEDFVVLIVQMVARTMLLLGVSTPVRVCTGTQHLLLRLFLLIECLLYLGSMSLMMESA